MKKLPYEQIWFSLEEYLSDNTFGKPYLSTVPAKWKKEFSTVTEMYNTIMLDIQHHVNLFFNELFSHVEVHILPINKLKLIKAACYSTFVSKLYGMLITDKNVRQTFSNNSGYSIEENQTRETNHYQDIFTPSAIKALNQTQIKQLWKAYTTWEEVFAHIKDKNFDYIYTAAEIDELIEIIRIESENLFKDIAAYVEDRLYKYKTELANDEDLIENISISLVENEELVNKFEEKLETKFTEKINNLETSIEQNKTSIEQNKTSIEQNKTSIEQNKTSIEQNKTSIEQNKTSIEQNKTIYLKIIDSLIPTKIKLSSSSTGIYPYSFKDLDFKNYYYKFAFQNANGTAMETPWCNTFFALLNLGLRSNIYPRDKNAANLLDFNCYFIITDTQLESYLDNELFANSDIDLLVFKLAREIF